MLRYKGDPGALSSEEKAKLKEYMRAKHPSAAKQVKCWIEDTFYKEFTISGVTKLIKKSGFSFKKPKQIPGNKERCAVKITKKSGILHICSKVVDALDNIFIFRRTAPVLKMDNF